MAIRCSGLLSGLLTMQDQCFGCSCDISGLRYRRLLHGSSAVRSAWHDIVLQTLPDESSVYQIQLSDPHKAYLCPTCSNSYERFYKIKESLNSIQCTLAAKLQAVVSTGMISVQSDPCSSNSQFGKRLEHDHHDRTSTTSISSKKGTNDTEAT